MRRFPAARLPALGLQWQWQANPQSGWAFPSPAYGFLLLFNVAAPDGYANFWQVPNLLLQKFPAPEFTATAQLTFAARADGDRTGLLVMGTDYAWVGLRRQGDQLRLAQVTYLGADVGGQESTSASVPAPAGTIYLRERVTGGARVAFSYSIDGREFIPLGQEFIAIPGRWIGAKVGPFALGTVPVWEYGYPDVDWFRVAAN